MGRLDDKVVVVTGASRGIGAEIARVFAAEGGKVVCAARTLREGDHPLEGSLDTTVAQIRESGGEATPSTVNISLPEDCERLMQEARDAYGPVDVLVNNAALTYFIPVKDYPLRRWMRSWAVNFHAPFILSQLALQDMIPRGSGSIVNISSGAAIGPGRGPYPDAPANSGGTCYGAEKAALERFTQGTRAGGLPVRHIRDVRVAFAGCADAGDGVPQPGERHGRPAGRAGGADGAVVAAAGQRTAR